MSPPPLVQEALDIAMRDLHACYTADGIVAGFHQHADLWARDSYFACYGALALHEYDIVEQTIRSFLRFQRDDGCIPYRIFSRPRGLAHYVGKTRDGPALLKPNFRSLQSGCTPRDGDLLTVILSAELFRRGNSSNRKYIIEEYPRLVAALSHAKRHCWNSLVWEGPYCSWEDSIVTFGRTLYTNVLFVRALRDMAYLSSETSSTRRTDEYQSLANEAVNALNEKFWLSEGFFAQWVGLHRHEYCTSHHNLLASFFGVSDEKQDRLMMHTLPHRLLSRTGFLETNDPKYPWWRISPVNHIGGVPDYQNKGLFWLQPQLLFVWFLQKQGRKRDALTCLTRVSALVIRHGSFYEVYERDGRPVRRLFYHAEHPFAWGVGLFLWVVTQLT